MDGSSREFRTAPIQVRLCVIRGIDVNVFDEANARAHEAALPVALLAALLRDSPFLTLSRAPPAPNLCPMEKLQSDSCPQRGMIRSTMLPALPRRSARQRAKEFLFLRQRVVERSQKAMVQAMPLGERKITLVKVPDNELDMVGKTHKETAKLQVVVRLQDPVASYARVRTDALFRRPCDSEINDPIDSTAASGPPSPLTLLPVS
uniref:Uncharacterized protein n=1 Tax=Vespula pensylvanica TaxID=30213 RepID=A0A834JR49_VESPE|nr:hypothetical protein H0235_017095 [Vespula pensylvanica]